MSETAVAEPLSGSEIIEAITQRLKEQLARDCFLSPNSAYEYFTGKITVSIVAVDCGRPAPVKITVEVTKGEISAMDAGEGYKVESTEDLQKQSPNVVRRETNQGVPITTTDGGGKVESKTVKYAKHPKPAEPSRGVRTPVPAAKPETPVA